MGREQPTNSSAIIDKMATEGGKEAKTTKKPDSVVAVDRDEQTITITVPQFSRRTLLKGAVTAIGAGVATVIAKNLGFLGGLPESNPQQPSPTNNANPTEAPKPSELNTQSPENLTPISGDLVFEGKDKEVSLENPRTKWMPDGHTAYFDTEDENGNIVRRYYLSGGPENATYMLETDGKKTLKEVLLAGEGNLVKVFGPDVNVKDRHDYAGGTSFVKFGAKPKRRWGFYHGEERVDPTSSGNYKAIVGLMLSEDNGKNWEDKGTLIVGSEVLPPGQAKDGGPTGAGQPCVIYNPKDGYVHGMYIDWSANENIQHPDQLYKFRMKANEDGTLGAVEYYTEDGYSTTFEPTKLKSVIPAGDLGYTALPSLSWNTKLNKWLCVGLSAKGFWQSESDDLDNWSTPQIRYDYENYGAQHGDAPLGGTWIYYPTLLSEQYESSETTGDTGLLYHSFTSAFGIDAHQPMALGFEMKTAA